jgi:hypothetical protein
VFEHMFMPLDRHFDDGFGAVGEAFKDAADRLVAANAEADLRFVNGHLPINFLYRHSIELFLKSMILVVHRRLRLPSRGGPHEPNPKIPVDGKWKEIHQVHGISDLYDFFKSLVQTHGAALRQIARTDWSAVPSELDAWIVTIDAADSGSTFFRYPTTKNKTGDLEKSSFKEMTPEDIIAQVRASGRPAKAFLLVDDGDNVVEAYGLDHEPLTELREALTKAVELLSGAHFGMRAELANGR